MKSSFPVAYLLLLLLLLLQSCFAFSPFVFSRASVLSVFRIQSYIYLISIFLPLFSSPTRRKYLLFSLRIVDTHLKARWACHEKSRPILSRHRWQKVFRSTLPSRTPRETTFFLSLSLLRSLFFHAPGLTLNHMRGDKSYAFLGQLIRHKISAKYGRTSIKLLPHTFICKSRNWLAIYILLCVWISLYNNLYQYLRFTNYARYRQIINR